MTEDRDDLFAGNKQDNTDVEQAPKKRPTRRKTAVKKDSGELSPANVENPEAATTAPQPEKKASIAKKTARKKAETRAQDAAQQNEEPAKGRSNVRRRQGAENAGSSSAKEIADTDTQPVEKVVESGSSSNSENRASGSKARPSRRKTSQKSENPATDSQTTENRENSSSGSTASTAQAERTAVSAPVSPDGEAGAEPTAKKGSRRRPAKPKPSVSAEEGADKMTSTEDRQSGQNRPSQTSEDSSHADTDEKSDEKKPSSSRNRRRRPNTPKDSEAEHSDRNSGEDRSHDRESRENGEHSQVGDDRHTQQADSRQENAQTADSDQPNAAENGETSSAEPKKRSRSRRKKPGQQNSNASGNLSDGENQNQQSEPSSSDKNEKDVALAAGSNSAKKKRGSDDKKDRKRGKSIRELHNNRVEEVRAAAEASAKISKELIINSTDSEIAIAMVENKQLVELNKEKCRTGFAVGDIYLGKVRKIMPGLNAAFISIGHEKDAFMHYLDLGINFISFHKMTAALVAGKKLPKFENLKIEAPLGKNGKISNFLAVGQPILVQLAKEAISTKGPRLTSEISLAGRHVVLMPFSNKVSISQKIRSNEEKKRLKRIADSVLPNNYGVIIRTAAVGKDEEDIANDIRSLVEKWEAAVEKLKGQQPPAQLLSEMNRATTIIRDLLNGSFSSITVDDKTMYEEIREYIKQIAPDSEKIVKLYKGNLPIFDNFDIAKQIQGLFAKYVSLKKGAYLIVEHTEALHVVDVNSGNRAKVDDDQEHTAMNVNLAAAEEIARQLRLRDMGGIIVIDFIDLHRGENRQLLYEKMQKFMSLDRAKHTILPLSKFGLMQITRQRVRPEVIAQATETCPACGGTGLITPTVLLDQQIENQIAYFASDRGVKYIKLKVSPYVDAFLKKGMVPLYMKWQWKYKTRIKVVTDQSTGFVETKFFDKDDNELV